MSCIPISQKTVFVKQLVSLYFELSCESFWYLTPSGVYILKIYPKEITHHCLKIKKNEINKKLKRQNDVFLGNYFTSSPAYLYTLLVQDITESMHANKMWIAWSGSAPIYTWYCDTIRLHKSCSPWITPRDWEIFSDP